VVQAQLRTVDTEEALATGKWTKITPEPLLTEWRKLEGDWSANDKGELVVQGNDGKGMIINQARIGPDFELRCEVEIEARDNCCRALGVVFGWDERNGECGTCLLGQGGRGPTLTQVLLGHFQVQEPRGKPLKFAKGPNHYYFRCQNGKITFVVNDTVLYDNHELERLSAGPSDGRFGLGSPRFCRMNTVTIRNIEVRRLKPSPSE
jgi:hypothetical protein